MPVSRCIICMAIDRFGKSGEPELFQFHKSHYIANHIHGTYEEGIRYDNLSSTLGS